MNALKQLDWELAGLLTGLGFGVVSLSTLVIDVIYCSQRWGW